MGPARMLSCILPSRNSSASHTHRAHPHNLRHTIPHHRLVPTHRHLHPFSHAHTPPSHT